jgi:hypothetical protein
VFMPVPILFHSYSKTNKIHLFLKLFILEKQVHLVGINIGIYYDARTYERQIYFIRFISVNPTDYSL